MEHNHSLLNLLFDIRLGGFLFIIALFLGYKKEQVEMFLKILV